MKRNLTAFLTITFFLILSQINAEVKLPAIFGDNMVLQQQSDAAIWGTSAANKTVKVTTSWDKKSYSTKADSEGNWKLKVKTPSAGGPFSITISDGKTLKLSNVLIGEVWVCSGQSNMQMIMNGYHNQPVLGSNEAIATSTNNSIRLITIEREKNLEAQQDFSGEWLECIPENVANFSATAYFFGKLVQKALGVPVGLISSSWGGTRIEPWMSESGIKKFDWVNLPDKNMEGVFTQQTPTVLFNAMISPMVGYAIKGGLWYQGESNRNEPQRYEKLMPGLIENWRAEWEIGDFAFYFCQIAPYDYGTNGMNSAFLREAQFNASTAIPNIGMACLMDVGEKNNIHPADKKAAGERLAYLALAKTYGQKGFEYSGPVLKEIKIEGSVVKLTFDHAKNGLTTFGKELVNFKIAGENKRFVPASATITREGISLVSPLVTSPVAVRYAFEDFVVGELFNNEGLPASSFRTDDW
ncbi:MAG: sialate O-acetylesterase [Prolixibacteraceae bacterium]|nr:sialate O-acetylesterase [Prolixibacteraceae bacterium]MBT6765371.1 sialate O-acetylesterase [Prolixibacteraceae bacterium]MBT7000273.1 sialate O-acetylesterase [Prolixibacteraceae bacterium]MBT7394089.1 sialate O-acetylesterase [Prolixibacteraceae bacterium]